MNFNDPTHIFIIAEAGSNWKCGSYEEDLNQSKNLIKYAFDSKNKNFPLCYPLQTTVAIPASKLVEKKVFSAVYWPTLNDSELNNFELKLKNQTIFLPLSNIRDRGDFEFLIETMSDLLSDQI